MKIIKTGIVIIGLLAASAQACWAADLMDVFNDALINDPTYQEATENYLAAREAIPQSISYLLPLINATGQIIQNRRDTQAMLNPIYPPGVFSFRIDTYNLNLTQPIFNYEAWVQVRQAKASVKQAYYQYQNAFQDLILRTASAYFAVLQANDEVTFAKAKQTASKKRYDQAKLELKVGTIPITVLNDTKAEYDRDTALVIKNETDVADRLEDLRAITGIRYDILVPIQEQLPLIGPSPRDIKQWERAASQHNLHVQATHYAAVAAKENVAAQRALNLPVVNAVGNLQKYKQGNEGFGPVQATTRSIGLAFTIPIFQGGEVLSLTRQAQHLYESALSAEERARRTTINLTRQSYLGIEAGIEQIKADRAAVTSSASALQSNEASFRAGLRTFVDVLEAQVALFLSQVAYSRDQYRYMLDQLTLKQAAGTLSLNDLAAINQWLDHKKSIHPLVVANVQKLAGEHAAEQ
jgi:outer membrane protein